MKRFRTSILKTAMAFMLVIAMAAGMTAWLGKTADAVVSYTITFNGNGGYIYGLSEWATTVKGGTEVSLPNATRVGYKLLGYSIDKNAKTPLYRIGQTVRAGSNMTLYAVWEGFYTVRYDYGHGDIYKEDYSCNEKFRALLGYKFTQNGDIIGWSTIKGAKTPTYRVGGNYWYAPLCKYGAGVITLYPVYK